MTAIIPQSNGTCPCKACQAHVTRGPRERERRKRMKIMSNYVTQLARQK